MYVWMEVYRRRAEWQKRIAFHLPGCSKAFGLARGLSQHWHWAHPNEHHAENMPIASKKAHWDHKELLVLTTISMLLISFPVTLGKQGKLLMNWLVVNQTDQLKMKLSIVAKNQRTRWKLRRFSIHFSQKFGTNLSKDVAETAVSYCKILTKTNNQFSFCETTPAHVCSLLLKLSGSNATGPDNIPAKLPKECPNLICESLSLIFNQSFKTGVFSNDWKNATVSPFYQNSGKCSDPFNYHPISVIPVVAKVLERIIYDNLYVHLTKYNLLSKHQSGFHSLHSTVTALLKATHSWALNIDCGLINAIVFLDLNKTFDTVDHEILLFWTSFVRNLWTSFALVLLLFRRPNTPKFLNVPQGTILGPLLFLLRGCFPKPLWCSKFYMERHLIIYQINISL